MKLLTFCIGGRENWQDEEAHEEEEDEEKEEEKEEEEEDDEEEEGESKVEIESEGDMKGKHIYTWKVRRMKERVLWWSEEKASG